MLTNWINWFQPKNTFRSVLSDLIHGIEEGKIQIDADFLNSNNKTVDQGKDQNQNSIPPIERETISPRV